MQHKPLNVLFHSIIICSTIPVWRLFILLPTEHTRAHINRSYFSISTEIATQFAVFHTVHNNKRVSRYYLSQYFYSIQLYFVGTVNAARRNCWAHYLLFCICRRKCACVCVLFSHTFQLSTDPVDAHPPSGDELCALSVCVCEC